MSTKAYGTYRDRGAATELVKYHERNKDPNEGVNDPFAALDGTG